MPIKKRPDKKHPVQHTTSYKKPAANAGFWQVFWYRFTAWSVRNKFWQRLGLGLLISSVLIIGGMYGIAQWYINKHKSEPLNVGATFIPNYARYFDLEPKETLAATIDDLGVKRLRFVSYWSDIEKDQGTYNFDELDWQMAMAEEKGAKVTLALGLRQPRWPECHMPSWALEMPGQAWYKPLEDFIETTVNRYKNSPALESYQLENEFFMSSFGICPDFNRDRLVSEFELVKKTDPTRPVIVSRSNNASPTWPVGEPRADIVGISVYKRVWDEVITLRYFEYPLPAWFYAFVAGATEITTGRNTFIHELQTESWVPDTFNGMKEAPISEQYKSMNPERLKHRFGYAKATGMRTFDVWGVEWWYWLKTTKNQPEIWDTARDELKLIQQDNLKH